LLAPRVVFGDQALKRKSLYCRDFPDVYPERMISGIRQTAAMMRLRIIGTFFPDIAKFPESGVIHAVDNCREWE